MLSQIRITDIYYSCLNPSLPDPERREKITSKFFVVPQSFIKAVKAFVKSFEAPQRSVKLKI